MSDFEFISVLLAIVAGLGITRLLSRLAATIEHREAVVPEFVVIAWAINVPGFHLIYWWVVVNNWRHVEVWSFGEFAMLFAYGVALYFCAAIVLPRAGPNHESSRGWFDNIRIPFFISWLMMLCLELGDLFLKGYQYVGENLGLPYLLIMSASVAGAVAALWTANRRFHQVYAGATGVLFAVWVGARFSTI